MNTSIPVALAEMEQQSNVRHCGRSLQLVTMTGSLNNKTVFDLSGRKDHSKLLLPLAASSRWYGCGMCWEHSSQLRNRLFIEPHGLR
jgi:hypothetical protein